MIFFCMWGSESQIIPLQPIVMFEKGKIQMCVLFLQNLSFCWQVATLTHTHTHTCIHILIWFLPYLLFLKKSVHILPRPWFSSFLSDDEKLMFGYPEVLLQSVYYFHHFLNLQKICFSLEKLILFWPLFVRFTPQSLV